MPAITDKATSAFTADDQRKLFSLLPTGVVAITGMTADNKPSGLIVGTFQSLSLDPPLVTFSVGKGSSTWPALRAQGKFTANILASDQNDICSALGKKGDDKFKNIDYRLSAIGTPRIPNATAWVDCHVRSEVVAGDHFVIVGSIARIETGFKHALVFSEGKLGACTPLEPQTKTSNSKRQEMLSRISDAWMRAWGKGETKAFEELVSKNYVRHSKSGDTVSLPEMLKQIEDSHSAFGEFNVDILHAIDEGDFVALHWRTQAKHTGTFMDVPATQREVTVHGASFMRHRDGQIVEEWVVWDPRELLASMEIWHLGDQKRMSA